jgi:hypothetical protein
MMRELNFVDLAPTHETVKITLPFKQLTVTRFSHQCYDCHGPVCLFRLWMDYPKYTHFHSLNTYLGQCIVYVWKTIMDKGMPMFIKGLVL